MESRTQYILNAFADLRQRFAEHDPFNTADLAEEETDFLKKWELLSQQIENNEADYSFNAQEILARFIRCYPNLVPLIKRELLWFIGGECLHYLGDEEIAFYQQLEDQLYELDNQQIAYDIHDEISKFRNHNKQLH
ncbi:PA2817 family protein [Marinomonas sp. THO17]|uniref:PA2817 family protein n=1 Tax=Marinomonas sp. THO17 TaxID=3149048 RepID=UPI00336C00F8